MINSEVADITPEHHPMGVLRVAMEEVGKNECVTAFVLLVRKDGSIWRDGCSVTAETMLWALEKEKQRLLESPLE